MNSNTNFYFSAIFLVLNIYSAASFKWQSHENAYNETTKQLNMYRETLTNFTVQLEVSLENISKPFEEKIDRLYAEKSESYSQIHYYKEVDLAKDEADEKNVKVSDCQREIVNPKDRVTFSIAMMDCVQPPERAEQLREEIYNSKNELFNDLENRQTTINECHYNKTGFSELRCISKVGLTALSTYFKIEHLKDLGSELVGLAKLTAKRALERECLNNRQVEIFWKLFKANMVQLASETKKCIYDKIDEAERNISTVLKNLL